MTKETAPAAEGAATAAKTFEHDTFLYHEKHGAKLFDAGAEHPGKGWQDIPFEAADDAADEAK